MEILLIIILIVLAVYGYIDHKSPDSKATSLLPGSGAVNQLNERKAEQIRDLEDKARRLNYAYPEKHFYRRGAEVIEAKSTDARSSVPAYDQAFYSGLSLGPKLEKRKENTFRHGLIEVPSIFTRRAKDVTFGKDGRNIIITVDASLKSNKDYADPKKIKELTLISSTSLYYPHHQLEIDGQEFLTQLSRHVEIVSIQEHRKSAKLEVALTIPSAIVLTDAYIEHEVKMTGRLMRPFLNNKCSFMMETVGENFVEKLAGYWHVRIDRRQKVASFFGGEKVRTMSDSQITQNLLNRLLARVHIDTISSDKLFYTANIMPIST